MLGYHLEQAYRYRLEVLRADDHGRAVALPGRHPARVLPAGARWPRETCRPRSTCSTAPRRSCRTSERAAGATRRARRRARRLGRARPRGAGALGGARPGRASTVTRRSSSRRGRARGAARAQRPRRNGSAARGARGRHPRSSRSSATTGRSARAWIADGVDRLGLWKRTVRPRRGGARTCARPTHGRPATGGRRPRSWASSASRRCSARRPWTTAIDALPGGARAGAGQPSRRAGASTATSPCWRLGWASLRRGPSVRRPLERVELYDELGMRLFAQAGERHGVRRHRAPGRRLRRRRAQCSGWARRARARWANSGFRSSVAAFLARALYGQGRLDEAEELARASRSRPRRRTTSGRRRWRAGRAPRCSRAGAPIAKPSSWGARQWH